MSFAFSAVRRTCDALPRLIHLGTVKESDAIPLIGPVG